MAASEFAAGALLTCAGRMPLLAHQSVLSPCGMAAMQDAGLVIAPNVEEYGDEASYAAAVRRRAATGETPAHYYPNPPGILSDLSPLVDDKILRELNNKGAFARHIDPSMMPSRRIVENPSEDEIANLPFPIVVKAATDEPNGAGQQVLVCENERHIKRAASRFSGTPYLVLEDYVDAQENWAVQCAIMPDGSVEIEGGTLQITSRSGIYAGNLFDMAKKVPSRALAVARAAAEAGAKAGYRGICGFDILVTRAEEAFLVDPNFRPTWSTPFLFHCQSLLVSRGMRCARFVNCAMPQRLDKFLSFCRPGFEAGWLLPVATYDPEFGNISGEDSRMLVMILGGDRLEIETLEKKLRRMGAEFTSLSDARLNAPLPKLLNKLSRRFWRRASASISRSGR
ncbi:hypothetical protein [Mesorhizobium sp. 10J20-29]